MVGDLVGWCVGEQVCCWECGGVAELIGFGEWAGRWVTAGAQLVFRVCGGVAELLGFGE